MKKYLYMLERAPGFLLDPYYYPRTQAEKIAKEANKEIRKNAGHQAEKITTKKIK